jgi:hypothetical protein
VPVNKHELARMFTITACQLTYLREILNQGYWPGRSEMSGYDEDHRKIRQDDENQF